MELEPVQVGRVRIVATINQIVGVYCANTTQWVRIVSWLPGDQGEAAQQSKGINQSLQMLKGEDTIIIHLHQHHQQCLFALELVGNSIEYNFLVFIKKL